MAKDEADPARVTTFNKTAYQREYMRRWRAEHKDGSCRLAAAWPGEDDPMSLEDVIARLEGAAEGGRDLDYAIHNAVYGDRLRAAGIVVLPEGRWLRTARAKRGEPPPEHYTTSLDAAMTLLPEGARLHYFGDEVFGWVAIVVHPDKDRGDRGAALTGPLALCIACLRAKAAAK